jgi:small GTP-binding protein
MDTDYLFKIILIGDCNVGKTSFLYKFVENYNTKVYEPTIGVDFNSKIVEDSNNNKIKLHIWDTAGQEKFRSIVETYYRDAAGVILIYDITNKEFL